MGEGYANCCEECDERYPKWSIVRVGDVVCTWACDDHLAVACERLQRDWEVTELRVKHFQKSVEWAQIGETLRTITPELNDGCPTPEETT